MVYRPYLTYCNIIWSIHHTEKKIIRIIRDESKPLFLALDVLNIYELNLYLIALFMYSYFNDNQPEYFSNYFRLNENIHSHDTRSASNIFIEHRRTNYGKFSLKYRGGGGTNLE